MNDKLRPHDAYLRSTALRLRGHARRVFMAAVCLGFCNGSARQAERRFRWSRKTVSRGLDELLTGRCYQENFAARGRRRTEDADPTLAADIQAIAHAYSAADLRSKTGRRFLLLSAADVRRALQTEKGYVAEALPSVRTLRDILRRLNFRPKPRRRGLPVAGCGPMHVVVLTPAAVGAEAVSGPLLRLATLEGGGNGQGQAPEVLKALPAPNGQHLVEAELAPAATSSGDAGASPGDSATEERPSTPEGA